MRPTRHLQFSHLQWRTPLRVALSLCVSVFFFFLSSDLTFARGASDAEGLREELHRQASQGQKVLSYNQARRLLMGHIYLEGEGDRFEIKDVYCQRSYPLEGSSAKASIGPDLIPEAHILNTEHTWPQSRFTKNFPKEMQKSDLHHLFPSDPKMNSLRGNHKFAEINGVTKPTPCPASRFGKTPHGSRFEPPEEHRGNAARALFYFSIRYKIAIDEDEEAFLKEWHQRDPVDADEIRRHEMIAEFQGNRNPFIDHPEWVEAIDNF